MEHRPARRYMRRAWNRLKRLLQPAIGPDSGGGADSPDDPYSYVGAPKKPRPPLRSSAVAVEPEP